MIVRWLLVALLLVGCITERVDELEELEEACALLPRAAAHAAPDPPGPSPKSASLYAEGATVDLYVELTAVAWDRLMTFKERRLKNVVPASFEFESERFEAAAIRLKGNSDRWGPTSKNQFVIRFEYYDKSGRFKGLRRVNLDHEGVSPLRNQVGMRVMRYAGIEAPRVNHARLHITVADSDDSKYPHGLYGLYENIEVIDREFLEDRFADPTGNLYKHGFELKTNKAAYDICDLDLLEALADQEPVEGDHAAFYAALPTLVDVDWMLTFMAAEAVMALGDNHWAGGNNYYYYNDPMRGMLLLPWDVDDVLSEVSPSEADIYDFSGVVNLGALPNHLWAVARQNPTWRAQFKAEVGRLRDGVFRDLGAVVAAECARIRPEVQTDPSRTFSMDEFDWDCGNMQQRVIERTAYLDAALE